MAVYNILFFALLISGVLLCEKKLTNLYLIFVFFVLFIMAAIRYTTGYDYNLYAGWYNEMVFGDYDWLMKWSREKGYSVTLKVLTVITTHYQGMFALIAFSVAAGVCLYIKKFSGSAYISAAAFISFGLYYNSMNFMRQFISAIIIAFAVRYIDSKQPLRYFVYVLFASCFHFSALIMIPLYFVLMIKMDWVVLCVYTAVAVLTYMFSVPVLRFVTENYYTLYDPLTSVHMLEGIPLMFSVIFGMLFILFFAFREELIKRRSINSVFINMSFFCAYFELIGIKHSIISRFAVLFMIPPVIALIPELYSVIMKKVMAKASKDTPDAGAVARIYKVAVAASFCLVGIAVNSYFLSINYNGVVPYRTIFTSSTP